MMAARTVASALIVALSVAFSSSIGRPKSRFLSEQQAIALAQAALTPGERKVGADFDHIQTTSRGYLMVTLVPLRGEGVVNFAVDRRTGDVWSPSRECFEITNDRVRSLQAKLRRQLGISQSDYRKLKTHGPLCDR
jgi:hypothetical protein